MGKTAIAWATETVNPLKGCSMVSAECTNCYALNWATRHQAKGNRGYDGTVKEGKFTGVIGVVQDEIDKLSKIRAERVFLNSMSDTFHANVPDVTVMAMFEAMARNPSRTDFLVCTKRPDRMAEFSQEFAIPDKVWCGTTVGCAKSLSRLNDLRHVRARIRWGSFEPLLEPLDISPWLADGTLSWVVVGGESGPRFRSMDKTWAENLWQQCQRYGVPFFLKQWSARLPKKEVEYPPTLHGRTWHEYPKTYR
jgi:protein gp37